MMQELGANLDVAAMRSTFEHPVGVNGEVAILLDACHMLKLIRNYLAFGTEFQDEHGGVISWKYVDELHKLQSQEGLRLGNKLKRADID